MNSHISTPSSLQILLFNLSEHCRCYSNRRFGPIQININHLFQNQSLLITCISQSQSANMQFSKFAFLAAVASVTAQTVSISDLPTCAVSLFKSSRKLSGFFLDSAVTDMSNSLPQPSQPSVRPAVVQILHAYARRAISLHNSLLRSKLFALPRTFKVSLTASQNPLAQVFITTCHWYHIKRLLLTVSLLRGR